MSIVADAADGALAWNRRVEYAPRPVAKYDTRRRYRQIFDNMVKA
jgi:hypothetical protein